MLIEDERAASGIQCIPTPPVRIAVNDGSSRQVVHRHGGAAAVLWVRGTLQQRQAGPAVEGREVQLSNLDKVLYPAGRFTKAQVIDYYRALLAAASEGPPCDLVRAGEK